MFSQEEKKKKPKRGKKTPTKHRTVAIYKTAEKFLLDEEGSLRTNLDFLWGDKNYNKYVRFEKTIHREILKTWHENAPQRQGKTLFGSWSSFNVRVGIYLLIVKFSTPYHIVIW